MSRAHALASLASVQKQALEAVKEGTEEYDVLAPLLLHIGAVTETGKLGGEFAGETVPFVNSFSPKLINVILRTRPQTRGAAKELQAVLAMYVKLLIAIMTETKYLKFVKSAQLIVCVKTHLFYTSTAPINSYGMRGESPYFSKNVKIFATQATLDKFSTFIERDDFDLEYVSVFMSVFMTLVDVFRNGALMDLANSASQKLYCFIEGLTVDDLRDINVKAVTIFISKLECMCDKAGVNQLNVLNVAFGMRLVKSGFMTQQCVALVMLRGLLGKPNVARKAVTDALRNQHFVEFFSNDIHYQLVSNFMWIARDMLKEGSIVMDDLKAIWKLTVDQRDDIMEHFIKAWNTMVFSAPIGLLKRLFYIIAKTNRWPGPVIGFIASSSMRILVCERVKLFKKISNFYFSEMEKDKKHVIDALVAITPTTSHDFCAKLQTICMDMIQRGEYLDYAMALFKSSWDNVDSQRACAYFDIIISTMASGTVEVDPYLELLVKIMEQLSKALTGDQFQKLMVIIEPMTELNLNAVCGLLKRVIYRYASSSRFFSRQMCLDILKLLCTAKVCDASSAMFIIQLVEKVSGKCIDESVPSEEYLWRLLFNTGCAEIADHLVSKYDRAPVEFIRKCFTRHDSVASLTAVLKLICFIEDGCDLEHFGIEPHRSSSAWDMVTVRLIGDRECSINVPKTISYLGFRRRVSTAVGRSMSAMKLSCGNMPITSTNFSLSEEKVDIMWKSQTTGTLYQCDMNVSEESMSHADVEKFPSSVLIDSEFALRLFASLTSDDTELASVALQILDRLPTIPFELDMFMCIDTSTPGWDKLLDIGHPFLFVYRLGVIQNILNKREMSWIQWFGESGGLRILLMVIMNRRDTNLADKDMFLLVNLTREVIEVFGQSPCIIEVCTSYQQKCATSIATWVTELSSQNVTGPSEKLMCELFAALEIFASYDWSVLKDNESFAELLKHTLFHSSRSVRENIANVVTNVPEQYHHSLIVPLLTLSVNKKCGEFFVLLKGVAETTDRLTDIFGEVFKAIVAQYTIPSDDLSEKLMFRPPPTSYTGGIFQVLDEILKRMDEVPDIDGLFNFVSLSVMLNSVKYFEPMHHVFAVLSTLIERKPCLAHTIIPPLRDINDTTEYSAADTHEEFVTGVKSRGLCNLGATCYLNATLQQLFAIREIRSAILHAQFTENDWCKELQYVFAELLFCPNASVNPQCFVSRWTDWGGDPINPKEQADAVEFLQMLLERLEDKIHGVTSVFRGSIAHTVVGRNREMNPIETTEDFLTLPLDVSGCANVEESLARFLIPDNFEGRNCYKVEGVGEIDADRYHRVRLAPEILVVQLKRFEYDVRKGTRRKVNSRYAFPMVLDIGMVMENGESVMYDLCGVVMHAGSSGSGHYFSHVKYDDGKWLTANDVLIGKCDKSQVLEDAAGGVTVIRSGVSSIERDCNAYLLFYRKQVVDKKSSDENEPQELEPTEYELREKGTLVLGNNGEGQIDSLVLERAATEARNMVLSRVLSSKDLVKLVVDLATIDGDGKFAYSFLVKYMRYKLYDNANIIADRCIAVAKTNREFAEFVLERVDSSNDFICDNNRLCNAYCSLLITALNAASETTLITQNTLLKAKITTVSSESASFNTIFRFAAAIVRRLDEVVRREWMLDLVHLFTEILPERSDGFLEKVDLGSALSLVSVIFELEPRLKTDFASVFTHMDFLRRYGMSRKHTCELVELVAGLLSDNQKQTERFLASVKNIEKGIMPVQCANLFLISLKISDRLNQKRDAVFTKVVHRMGTSYVIEMLREMAQQASVFDGSLAGRFTGRELILPLCKRCLFCSDKVMRNLFAQLTRAILTGSDDKVLLAMPILFRTLLDSHSTMESMVCKMGGLRSEVVVSGTYFTLLWWVVKQGGLYKEIHACAKELVSILKRFVAIKNATAANDCFRFIHNITCTGHGEPFFTTALFIEFVKAVGKIQIIRKAETAEIMINMVPLSSAVDFIKSELFQSMACNFFCYQDCGRKLRHLIETAVSTESIKGIAAALGTNRVFETNVKGMVMDYMVVYWKLLRKFQSISNEFQASEHHFYIWRNFVKREVTNDTHSRQSTHIDVLRPMANLLAEFNLAYIRENEGKKGKRKQRDCVECLAQKWREEGVDIPRMATVSMTSLPRTKGSCGLFCLLKSFIMMDRSFCSELFDFVYEQSDGYLHQCPADVQCAGADLVTALVGLITGRNSENVNALLVREFVTLSGERNISFEVVNKICESLYKLCGAMDTGSLDTIAGGLNKLYTARKCVRMMSASVLDVALFVGAGNAEAWLRRCSRILSDIVINAGLGGEDLQQCGSRVHILIEFMKAMSGKHGHSVPVLSANIRDVDALVSKFRQAGVEQLSEVAGELAEFGSETGRM